MAEEPNLPVVDAFKPVIDAALRFDALWLPDYGESPERLERSEAELLADYAEQSVAREPGSPDHMRPLAALAHLLTSASHLQAVVRVLKERSDDGAERG